MPGPAAQRVCVAQIGAPHGVRGEVKLKSFTADPLAIKDYGALETEDGATSFQIEGLRATSDRLIARLSGVSDRDAAAQLTGMKLFVPRERLPAAEAGEFYHADLIGLAVQSPDGSTIGTVVAIHNFGAGDLIEVKPAGEGSTVLVPFTEAAVPVVDVAAGRIVIDAPEGTFPDSAKE